MRRLAVSAVIRGHFRDSTTDGIACAVPFNVVLGGYVAAVAVLPACSWDGSGLFSRPWAHEALALLRGCGFYVRTCSRYGSSGVTRCIAVGASGAQLLGRADVDRVS